MLVLREKRVGAPRIQQFRETHHRVARLVAAGLRDAEISRMTGYSPNRIGQFKQDPAFLQLVAEYRGKVDEAYVSSQDEFYDTATSNMLRAERMIESHLDKAEDESDLIPLKTLITISADRADRFGYGKKSTQTNEIQDFAKMMETLAARSGRSNVIDAPPPVKASASPPSDSSQEPSFGDGSGFRRRIQGR
jgi:hypothetical protein